MITSPGTARRPVAISGGRLRVLLTAGLIAVAVVLLSVVSGASERADAATRSVKVANNFFSPTSKTIARDRTVTWVWVGGVPHDVVIKNRNGKILSRSKITKTRGYTYSRKFTRNGTYKIVCSIHPEMRMTVKVG